MAATTRRQYLAGGTTIGAGLLVAACDIAGSTGGEVAPDAIQESRLAIAKPPGSDLPRQTQRQIPVLVRFIPSGFGPLTVDQFHEYTAPFTEAHPHLAIEWQDWRYLPEFREALQEAIASGQAGDIMQDIVNLPWWLGDPVPELVVQGALLGLNQFIRRDRYDLSDFWPGCLERSTWRGDLYALHTHADTQLMFYNPDLLAAAGRGAPVMDAFLVEALEDTRLELAAAPGPKALYVLSDMIQHAGWYSHLELAPEEWDFQRFADMRAAQTALFGPPPPPVAGLHGTLFYIPRRGVTDTGDAGTRHRAFWRGYFHDSVAFEEQPVMAAYAAEPLMGRLTELEVATREQERLEREREQSERLREQLERENAALAEARERAAAERSALEAQQARWEADRAEEQRRMEAERAEVERLKAELEARRESR